MNKVKIIGLLILLGSVNVFASEKEMPEKTQQLPFEITSPHSDLEIEAKRCYMSGRNVIIEFLITNLSSKDIELLFYGGDDGRYSSNAYDNEGNKYYVKLGVSGTGKLTLGSLGVQLPSEVPVKILMQVPDIDKSAEYFSRINLNFYCTELGFNPKGADKNNFRVKNLVIQGR